LGPTKNILSFLDKRERSPYCARPPTFRGWPTRPCSCRHVRLCLFLFPPCSLPPHRGNGRTSTHARQAASSRQTMISVKHQQPASSVSLHESGLAFLCVRGVLVPIVPRFEFGQHYNMVVRCSVRLFRLPRSRSIAAQAQCSAVASEHQWSRRAHLCAQHSRAESSASLQPRTTDLDHSWHLLFVSVCHSI